MFKNEVCPICNCKLNEKNVARNEYREDKPVKLDYAGRVICRECMDWIENTDWD